MTMEVIPETTRLPAIDPACLATVPTAGCNENPPVGVEVVQPPELDPDLWLYRDRTVALLKRYLRLSVEAGRLPSLLGREFFRTRVTAYGAATFEDAIIFVHDVERSLEKLDEIDKKLLAFIVFQEHTHDEAAKRIGCWRRTIGRRFNEAVDRLTSVFLEGGLLLRLPKVNRRPKIKSRKSCQEGGIVEIAASDSCETK